MRAIDALRMRSPAAAASVIDGTLGSTNAGILAAVYFTQSGTTVTVVNQKNVASVARLSAGIYRVTLTSAVASANYGILASGRRVADTNNNLASVMPRRNITPSTTVFDVICRDPSLVAQELSEGTIIIFDPASVGSDYLAAALWTLSGTTITLQSQTNVASVSRQASAIYRVNFNSSLANADYQSFPSSRFPNNADENIPMVGDNRNSGRDTRSTAALDLNMGLFNDGNSYDAAWCSTLIKAPATAPRGTLGSVRFTVSGGVVTLVSGYNVGSVTRQGTGLYTVNFTTPLSDSVYGMFGNVKLPNSTNDRVASVGLNNNTTGANLKSTTQASIAIGDWSAPVDPAEVNLWFVKPWLM